MCSGMNHKRMGDIAKESREEEQIILLKKRMAEAWKKDQSHTKRLSENV